MSSVTKSLLVVIVFTVLFSLPAVAQESSTQSGPQIDWQEGPVTGSLGSVAEITVPQGYRFTGSAGAKRFMELTQNPPSGRELGVLIPDNAPDDQFWFVVFEFKEIGYVKDDDKDDLDADAILSSIRDGNAQANKVRKQRGWNTLDIVGWERQPFYDARSKNLTWAIRARTPGDPDDVVNYSTRVLGRRGTMNVDLVLDPKLVASVTPQFDSLIGGFTYKQGSRYSEFTKGDKVAAYGLTALVAGGVGAAAAKSGLLGKFWKLIVVGILAIGAFFKKLFVALRRKFSNEEAMPPVNYLDQK